MGDGAQDDRIDIRTTVDWNSRNTLLKAEFPMSVSNAKAAYDLGIGFIERGNNTATAYEVPALKWADLTDADGVEAAHKVFGAKGRAQKDRGDDNAGAVGQDDLERWQRIDDDDEQCDAGDVTEDLDIQVAKDAQWLER